ncbi:MAG: response regulator [Bacteroidetes bacterium]|nr:response regulator [Bacteroidota bacterium]
MARQLVILCVDDEKIVTDALISQLRATYGTTFLYEAASDVEEAYEILEDITAGGNTLCLIISDWLMPRIKGDAFLRDMHQQDPGVPLIMLSGQADDQAVSELIHIIPEFEFVRKPWEKHELMSVVDQMIQRMTADQPTA